MHRYAATLAVLAFFPTLAHAQEPTLRHSAPFLGETLTLVVEGAAALQPIRLFASPAADERELPFGTLELNSQQMTLVAQGNTTAGGRFSVDLSLPDGASNAEEPWHYQALVNDPSAPAGAVFSEAVHLRVLGSRAYVVAQGLVDAGTVYPGDLSIVSAVQLQVVERVDFGKVAANGEALGDGHPVFDASVSRGAVMASPFELVLFDPFFGGVLRTLAFEEASRTLLVDALGERLFVLETGLSGSTPRVHALDFATGDTLAVVDLPRDSSGLWVADPDGTAYITEFRGALTEVRRFDLNTLQQQGSFAVGSSRSKRFSDLLLQDDQLFVGTESFVGPDVLRAELSRVDLTGFPPAVEVTILGGLNHLRNLTAAPAANLLFFSTLEGFFPGGQFWRERLVGSSPLFEVALPGIALGVNSLTVLDLDAWALIYSVDGDEAERLFHFDIPTSAWTELSSLSCFSGGVEIAALRDAYVDTVVFAVGHCGPVGFQDPLAVFHDPSSGVQTEVPVGLRPSSVGVAAVPQ